MNPRVINDLRKNLGILQERNKTLQLNLEAQSVEVKELYKLYFKLKDDYAKLERNRNTLQNELEVALERNRDPIIFNKVWCDVKCWKTKRKRKHQYRSELDSSIKNIVECVKARVILTVGTEEVFFQWSEQELEFNRETLRNRGYVLPMEILPRINVVHHGIEGDNYTERADDPFRFTHTKEEIRKALFVMDIHSIGHHAYHELHMLSKGILPAMNYIKQEKEELRNKLDHYLIDGVSTISTKCTISISNIDYILLIS